MPRTSKTPDQLFWSKVRVVTAGCWEWTGATDACGYGRILRSGHNRLAHRTSVEIVTGLQVPRGLVVGHHCDNPKCVRPSHLFVGTQADNIADMDRKGRRGTVSKAV